jgi:hypothetical protein
MYPEKVVTGLTNMVIADVPYTTRLAFCFFPDDAEKASRV